MFGTMPARPFGAGDAPGAATPRADRDLRFDVASILLGVWFLGGLYLDGWAHANRADLETFFTPWHAVLYAAFFANGLFFAGAGFVRWRRGAPLRSVMPDGYGLSLVGVFVFFAGGVGDMLWHTFLGVEASVEALVSPTHLMLAAGLALIVSGPLRAAWRRDTPASLGAMLPALVSVMLLLSVLTFFTQYSHPLIRPWAASGNAFVDPVLRQVDSDPHWAATPEGLPSADIGAMAGLAGFLIQSALLSGLLLLVARRWAPPPGAISVILIPNAIGLALMRVELFVIPVAVLAAVAADVVVLWLRPTLAHPARLRFVAAALPLLLWSAYFAVLSYDRGLWWSVHLWTGAIVIGAAAGFLASWLVVPPSTDPRAGISAAGEPILASAQRPLKGLGEAPLKD